MEGVAYNWLQNYLVIKNDAIYLEYELQKYTRELKRWTSGDLSGVKLEPRSRASRLEEIIEDLEYDLALKMNEMYEVEKMVRQLKGLEHDILYRKHIEGKKLVDIATELDKDPNYIYNKHSEIMRKLKFKYAIT